MKANEIRKGHIVVHPTLGHGVEVTHVVVSTRVRVTFRGRGNHGRFMLDPDHDIEEITR